MAGSELVMFLTNDLSGVSRGKAFPARQLDHRLRTGVGWVPANQCLTPFGVIAEGDPFGPMGDLRLMADPATAVRLETLAPASPLHVFLGDIVHTDGRPWECDTRLFLRTALAELEREAGLRLLVAFEQEFALFGLAGPPTGAFTLAALRQADRFATTLVAALEQAGVQPEMFLPEYGEGQYEVTCRPAPGLAAADRAVVIRELTRETARALGLGASFAPKVRPDGVGNGVHIHFSLHTIDGRPVTDEPGTDGPLSPVAGQFAAGVLRHLPALAALTAPSAISALRLRPHHWSAGYTCLGHRNREAALRICPVLELPGFDRAAQANLEYRAADAAACPYVALGAVVRAGLAGIRDRLPPPPVIDRDPDAYDEAEKARLGLRRLPETLEAALDAWRGDPVAAGWLPATMAEAYLALKRAELKQCGGLTPEEACAKYAAVY